MLIFGGMTLAALAMRLMSKAGTHIDPFRATTAIVSSGPFARTRNPIYLAMALMYCGAALAFDVAPALLLLPLVIVTMNLLIIRREERYLERKFGDAYRDYRKSVRRWI